jgi:hypothetical protein
MNPQEYRQNRASFTAAELVKHDGQWVAFTADGRRIIASHEDFGALNDLVVAAGENPETVAFERIELNEVSLGSAELQ